MWLAIFRLHLSLCIAPRPSHPHMASAVVEIAPLSDGAFKRVSMDNGATMLGSTLASTHHHRTRSTGLAQVKGCSPPRVALAVVFCAAVIAAFIVLVRTVLRAGACVCVGGATQHAAFSHRMSML